LAQARRLLATGLFGGLVLAGVASPCIALVWAVAHVAG
jgi:hypothetical protein